MAHAPDATDGDPSSLEEAAKLSDPELDDLARGADGMYHRYPLVQKGRARWIDAPEGRLKRVQRAILDTLLYRLDATEHAHGFVPGRSILTHARLHCGRAFVVTADVRRFFPSVRRGQVAEATGALGLDETDSARLLKLVTRRGRLPQGAPTSPHLANLVFAPADGELASLARPSGWRYSRYADDLAFSGDGDAVVLIREVGRVVRAHGFRLSDRKTRVMPRRSRQLVTGLV
ncbi:MAG: reverse transcriptase family protein, partial [Planctomycetota bacterium]